LSLNGHILHFLSFEEAEEELKSGRYNAITITEKMTRDEFRERFLDVKKDA